MLAFMPRLSPLFFFLLSRGLLIPPFRSQQLASLGRPDYLNIKELSWKHPIYQTPWVAFIVNALLISFVHHSSCCPSGLISFSVNQVSVLFSDQNFKFLLCIYCCCYLLLYD
jgi:hypothetical protein